MVWKRIAQDLLFYLASAEAVFMSQWLSCHSHDGQGMTKPWCEGLSFFMFLHSTQCVILAQ